MIASNSNIITSAGQLSSNVVTTAKILDANVTPAKISSGNNGEVLTTVAGVPAWAVPVSVPVGAILPYAGSSAPSGFAITDGSAKSRTVEAALFAIIGTTYGAGDGSTTFNVPDLRGKIPVGYSSGETEFDTLGETGGEKTHVLTVPEMPAHSHVIDALTTSGGSTGVARGSSTVNNTATTTSVGGGGAHQNLQPYITLNYIIKT